MKRTIRIFASIAILALPNLGESQTRPVDWDAVGREAQGILSEYLKINTTNPPGNEILAARFLKGILDREGIPATIVDTAELGGQRANLYARLKGNGSKKAIALLHHMDVVPATPSLWSVDPFSGAVKDGYIWGRGAIDMKGEAVAHLMAMIAIKRSGMKLNRDIVFIANADEEFTSTGGLTFVKNHADLLKDVEYLITEATENSVVNGKVRYFSVGVAEKRTFWQRLRVKGVPSHGSRPTTQNPVPRLVAALDKIAKYETPLHVTPGVDRFFRDISRLYPEPRKTWLADISKALQIAEAREWILSDVYWNAYLRNTISITGLSGSNKTNVIPPEATAEIDVRLLPDTDPAEMLATLQRIVGDTAVHFETILAPKTPLESPIDTELFRAIERAAKEREPSAFVTTPMQTGATDRPTYRKLGIITYAIDPFRTEQAERQMGVHGNNERLSVQNVGFGVKYVYDILRYVQ
ncbi:MAG TPA: M20/M25/M40 family metallo-hydrolase [Gemmatimonadaceae bacterium]|nr:M20/M25/M40 family metallo-hydrolase [Gemmatimonadaceae bacterium]